MPADPSELLPVMQLEFGHLFYEQKSTSAGDVSSGSRLGAYFDATICMPLAGHPTKKGSESEVRI
jgi:hypothetical protein